jgi:hypothetical protein
MTAQERDLLLNGVIGVSQETDGALKVRYDAGPQADLVGKWPSEGVAVHAARQHDGRHTGRQCAPSLWSG